MLGDNIDSLPIKDRRKKNKKDIVTRISDFKNVPQDAFNDVPLGLVGLDGRPKRLNTKVLAIQKLGEDIFWKRKKGLEYRHLMDNGLAKKKSQAQNVLKRYRRKRILFTWGDKRPQKYYPTSIKSEIMKYLLSENVPIEPSGVTSELKEIAQDVCFQTLMEYVLPLLPEAPLYFHNLHLKFKVKADYYEDVNLSRWRRNQGKHWEYSMCRGVLTCVVYPNGTIDIYVECSNKPFRLESYLDVGRLLIFLGQAKAFVIDFLHDPHERAIPDVMEWILTECDINKDIAVSDAFHIAALKVQGKIRVRDFEIMLRVYFKAMGENTVFRVEMGGFSVGMRVGQLLSGLLGLREYVPES